MSNNNIPIKGGGAIQSRCTHKGGNMLAVVGAQFGSE